MSLSFLLANPYCVTKVDAENGGRQPGPKQHPSSFLYRFPSPGTIAAHSSHLPPAHLDLLNLGMGVEKLLKFCWIDVLSSPNNHVLATAYNFAVAVFIQARNVPATTPRS